MGPQWKTPGLIWIVILFSLLPLIEAHWPVNVQLWNLYRNGTRNGRNRVPDGMRCTDLQPGVCCSNLLRYKTLRIDGLGPTDRWAGWDVEDEPARFQPFAGEDVSPPQADPSQAGALWMWSGTVDNAFKGCLGTKKDGFDLPPNDLLADIVTLVRISNEGYEGENLVPPWTGVMWMRMSDRPPDVIRQALRFSRPVLRKTLLRFYADQLAEAFRKVMFASYPARSVPSSVLPDVIIVQGREYSDGKRGDGVYVDEQGDVLRLRDLTP